MTATEVPWRSLALLLAALFAAGPVHAQDTSPAARDPIAAEALFERGKLLMDGGHVAEACAAFGESQRLDPAGGTLLRLALCHEAAGKLASAWLEYLEVVRVSQEAAGDTGKLQERVRLARVHLQTIEPRVPKLAIGVSLDARVEGLRVSANGLPRNEGTWGVALPVDPGDVAVVATAPGHREYRATVRMSEGQRESVDVPPLPPLPSAAALPPPPPPATRSSALRPIGVGVGLAGVAALGVGTYFGVRALGKWRDANSACPGSSCNNVDGIALASDAKSAAGIADVALIGGALVVAAGVILYLVGAPAATPTQGAASGLGVSFE